MHTVTSASTTNPLNVILGLGATLLVVAVVTGANEKLGLGARTAFWMLFAVGFVMCALGPLGQGADFGWLNPRHIAGYVLGATALCLGVVVLFDLSLPLVGTTRAAFLALALVMAAKFVIAHLYPRVG